VAAVAVFLFADIVILNTPFFKVIVILTYQISFLIGYSLPQLSPIQLNEPRMESPRLKERIQG